MGVLAPNILEVGDIGHLAALVAPRPLVFTHAPIEHGRRGASPDDDLDRTLARRSRFVRSIYQLAERPGDRLKLAQPAVASVLSCTRT